MRNSASVLPESELLPSQIKLLNLSTADPASGVSFTFLHGSRIVELGEFLAYDLTLAAEERNGTDRDKNQALRELALAAHTLINLKDTVAYAVSEESFSGEFEGMLYTPEGMIPGTSDKVKQKVITFNMRSAHRYDDGSVIGHTERTLRLYSDNISAKPPLWEFIEEERASSNILPTYNHLNNYNFMSYPQGFHDETLALSVVESLSRIISGAHKDDLEKIEQENTVVY